MYRTIYSHHVRFSGWYYNLPEIVGWDAKGFPIRPEDLHGYRVRIAIAERGVGFTERLSVTIPAGHYRTRSGHEFQIEKDTVREVSK